MTAPSHPSPDSAEAMLERIPFDDDADEPKTWRGLAHSILLDMFRYAKDETPARRLVSAEAYVEDALRLARSSAATEDVCWRRVNDEPFEYAIQQGPHGDEFVKLLNGTCLRRALAHPRPHRGGGE